MALTKEPLDASPRPCVFCNTTEDNELKYGKLHHKDDITTHYFCLLLSSNMQQRGKDEEGILGFLLNDIKTEVRRGKRLSCAYCKKRGATLGCCNVKCPKSFHLPCGLINKTLHLFYDEFKSYCINHRPTDKYMNKILRSPEKFQCNICYDDIDATDKYSNLLAPCCQETALFHRDCIQKFAITSGYFFKCPLCNNKKTFKKAMIKNGIFVPCQDAAWELEPDAFNELLQKHDRCDADNCICPAGRYFTTDENWRLLLCHTCASQGIHIECGQFNWKKPLWNCHDCMEILRKSSNGMVKIEEEYLEDADDNGANVEYFVNELCMNLKRSFRKRTRPGPRASKVKLLRRLRKFYENDRRKLMRSIACADSRFGGFDEVDMNPININEAIKSLSNLLERSEGQDGNDINGDDRKEENSLIDEEILSVDRSIYADTADEEIEIVQLPSNSRTEMMDHQSFGNTGLLRNNVNDLAQFPGKMINYSSISLPGPSQMQSGADRSLMRQFTMQTANGIGNGAVRVAGPILQQEKNDENMRIVGCHQAANSESQMTSDVSANGIDQNNLINLMGMFLTYCPFKLLTRNP